MIIFLLISILISRKARIKIYFETQGGRNIVSFRSLSEKIGVRSFFLKQTPLYNYILTSSLWYFSFIVKF